ncbi:MAG: rRNA maturation RNase YbeY [Acidobacteria bacterium]|nr:rRNA maturation RNase YbeY [Acidobacteriota bacterium]
MNIELSNLTDSKCDLERLKSIAQFTILAQGVHPDSELNISLLDVDEMSALHLRWMKEDGPTDVLAFPMDEVKPNSATLGPAMLGDIALCPTYANQNALKVHSSLQDELELLTVHGVLHLLGYDHMEADEKEVMFALQDKYLVDWRAKR